jgi:hypothetical protein
MKGDSDGAGYSVEGSTPEPSYTQVSLNYSGFDAGSSFDQGTQLSLDSGVVAVIPVVQLAGDDSGFDAGIFLAQLAGNDSGVDPGHAPGDTDSGASFDPGAHAQDMNQSPGDGVNVTDQVSHGGDPSHNPGLGMDHSGTDGYHSDFASPNESDQVA